MKHISAEQGEAFLVQLVSGTVTHFPGSFALLVTAPPSELAKARIILELVDSPDQFVIRKIFPLSAARKMPSNAQIAAKLSPSLTRGLSIGNFSDPPSVNASARAIIDIHNDSVIAIAPAALVEKIVAAIGPLSSLSSAEEPQKPQPQEKAQAASSQKASELNGSAEAKFVLAAKGPAAPEPNAAAAPQEKPQEKTQEAPKSPAAPAKESPALPNADQVVDLALADRQKLTIAELLGLVGPYLQLDFMYEQKDVDQEVTLNPHGKFRGPIKISDLYSLLEEVLKFKNLAMTRGKGNLVTIVPIGNALDIDPMLLEAQKESIERGNGIVQKIFTLKHIDINSAQNLLTGMRMTTSITPIPETKTLIVTGYAHRMPRIQTLLDLVDQPGEPKKFRLRTLRYTMAQTLAPKLQTLAEQLGTISITVADTAQTAAPVTPSPIRPGETNEQYQLRLRAEEAARARQLASLRAATAVQQPTAGPPAVYLDADDRTNRILMIGLDKQLDEVEQLIDTLDVSQQDPRTLELYKIKNIDAMEARKKLEELGIVSPSMMTESTRLTEGLKPGTTTTTPGAATTPTMAARPLVSRGSMTRGLRPEGTEQTREEPQVVIIEPTNSLLVNATAEQHTRIKQILELVDKETDKGDIPYIIYPLENQSPEHLEQVLSKLIQETIKDKEGKIQQVIPKQDEQITIVPDPNTFSLVVFASKKNQEWISTLVEQLDQRRPQVLIDVTLVQISKTDAFNYDLNLISSFPDLTSTSGLTSAIMPGTQGTNLVSPLINSGRDRFVDLQSNGGSGTGFYGDRHINTLLTMMQQKDYGRVLAKPKILVNDNQTGTISTTDTTYVTKKSSIPLQSGAAGNQTTVVETQIDYQGYDAGITLEIQPHISRGNFLRLDITLTRSDFGTITGEKPPDTTKSDVKTTVTVPDQSTIILGGLLKLNQSKGGTKIPLLGDLPLIGGLFRSASNSDLQRNLYVFVKAEIIRPEDEGIAKDGLQQISQRNRNAFEEYETEFQEYNDWPGIKPKTMTPDKVLDAQ